MSANQRYADAVTQILTHKGDVEAEGIRRQSDIKIGAISAIGQTVASGVQQYSAQRKDAQIQEIFKTTPDLDEAIRKVTAIDPQRGLTYSKGLAEAKLHAAEMVQIRAKAQREQAEWTANTLGAVKDQAGWTQAIVTLGLAGIDPKAYPAEYDPAIVAQFQRQSLSPKDRAAADAPLVTKPGDIGRDPTTGAALFTNPDKPEPFTLAPGGTRYDATGQVIAQGPAAPAAPFTLAPGATRFGADGTEVARGQTPPPSASGFTLAPGGTRFDANGTAIAHLPDRPRAASSGGGSGSDVHEAIAGMKDGTIPPQLPGRASKEYTAMMAEAHRQGYDLAGAVTDWAATQKHIATLNGAQQTRLMQAIDSLPAMLDRVDDFAAQWKAGGFPLLNSAHLKLAKGGAYGTKAATIANGLEAQIADVTADLGNVYMGGNSPTDHALDLASRSLKAEWSEPVLHKMVTLARDNIQTRRNSILHSQPVGASAGNPYAPPPAASAPAAAPPGRQRVKGPNGETGTAPIGAPMPPGWVVVP
jgi:hypothetical protein